MSEQVIDHIAKDLGLNNFQDGLDKGTYHAIVIYSAASQWFKATINDISYNHPVGSHKHCIHVVNEFIQKMIDIYPDSRTWFSNIYAKYTPAQELLNIMLKAGELNQLGVDSDNYVLSRPKFKCYAISETQQI